MEETSSADRQDFDWPPLESNPDVFNDYLHQVGLAESFAVGEIYGFDEDLLAFVPQPVYGVIVALEKVEKQHNVGDDSYLIPFYMKQAGTLDNACGIIACLHAILNVAATSEPSIIMTNSVLHQFQALTATQTPMERCHSLEKNLDFRTVHQTFAQQGQSQAILRDQSQVKCHYVAFVVSNGQLIELDGTLLGPHVVAENCTDVLRGSIAEIQKRLEAGHITENLSVMTLNAAVEVGNDMWGIVEVF